MAQRRSLEEKLAELAELEQAPASPDVTGKLRETLKRANNILAARAAEAIAARGMDDMIPDLVAAFDRFMANPLKTDKGCLAKTAICEALNKLESDETDTLLQGARHAQLEPVYGGKADTAANLRIESAHGLIRAGYPDALFELTALLMDREAPVRRAAAKAVAYLGREACELLLRMKLLAGDADPDVIGECFTGLMTIAPERSMAFVDGYVSGEDAVLAESAALALGSSGVAQAFHVLRRHWEQALDAEFKKILLLPIALIRSDEALDFLLDVVRDEHRDKAVAAVAALDLYGEDETQRERIRRAVEEREDAAVADAFEQTFGSAR